MEKTPHITWTEILGKARSYISGELHSLEVMAYQGDLARDIYKAERSRLEAQIEAIDIMAALTVIQRDE